MDVFWKHPFDSSTQELGEIFTRPLSPVGENNQKVSINSGPDQGEEVADLCPGFASIRLPRTRRHSEGSEDDNSYSKKLFSTLEANFNAPPESPSELLEHLGYIVNELGVRRCVHYIMWLQARIDSAAPPAFYQVTHPGFFPANPALGQTLVIANQPLTLSGPAAQQRPPSPLPAVPALQGMPALPSAVPLTGQSRTSSPVYTQSPQSPAVTGRALSVNASPGRPGAKRNNSRPSRWVAAGLPDVESEEVFHGQADSTSRKSRNPDYVCVFCRNNGETSKVYKSHRLKDVNGCIRCPVLRAYVCPTCGATGDNAHTLKYCPRAKETSRMPFAIYSETTTMTV